MTTKQLTKVNTRNSQTRKKILSVGDICDLKITSFAPNNIVIDEFSYPFAIFVPNAKEGNIKAKIVKKAVTAFKDSSYAVAQLISTSQDASKSSDGSAIMAPVKAGDILTVNISKKTQKGAGIVEFTPDYKILVAGLGGQDDFLPKNVKIQITRVKSNYAFSILTGRGSEAARYNHTKIRENFACIRLLCQRCQLCRRTA